MIKRSESESASKFRRRKTKRDKRRRLKLEGLEQRQLLAGDVLPIPVVDIPTFFGARNVGSVTAFNYFESETVTQSGENDYFTDADVVPLGNLPGQQNTVDITGSLPFEAFPNSFLNFSADLDTFAVDLRAGDILDISTFGAAGTIDVQYSDGTLWFATDIVQGTPFYPADSPLQTLGNSVAAQVVPEDGRYYLVVAPQNTAGGYTLGLRTYRPIVESLPIGTQQVVFLDFDGAIYPRTVFDPTTIPPAPGRIIFPTLRESLPLLGIQELDDEAYDRLIDLTIAEVETQFHTLVTNGNNGDYDATGIPGEYGVLVLNSRDHADPGFNPLVTRVLIGGSVNDVEIGTIGLSSTIDVGNFSMDDIVFGVLDAVVGGVTSFPISNTASVLDATADFLALLATHEAGHSFGMRHTENSNLVPNIMDSGGFFDQAVGVGIDGIYGTIDDVDVEYIEDRFAIVEGIIGRNRTADSLANTLLTGTAGGSVRGRAFSDANRDGRGVNDAGLPGVRVFADVNGNGLLDPTDPTDITNADGTYTLAVGPGTFDVIAVTPAQYAATTVLARAATVGLGGTVTGIDFGFNQVIPDITGTKFADFDGDGNFDEGEPGIEGVYIYLDLDGDDRPDLGEPAAETAEDGTYAINFPGPGTYTIREVLEPGFIQTFPVGGEHIVTFNGIALTDNYNFGNLPSLDFGDAPDSYRTTIASGGPSHGITPDLRIGDEPGDRELDGQPTASATGDDVNGSADDEDGVVLSSPLSIGESGSFEVSLFNGSGSPAYLQAWMDFNGNGVFDDPGEQFASDLSLGTGSHTVPISIPSSATTGTTFARFRYSATPGLGIGGDADTGEVEDYSFQIRTTGEIAVDDEFSVSRNTLSNELPVLANDFEPNDLTISSLDTFGTDGTVRIASDGQSVFYTPRNGFVGRDEFGYTVRDQFGELSTARVVVNVQFQSANPIAVDDSFEVPEGSVQFPLNVLDNDVPSTAGGISITSFTQGSAQGTIEMVGGGQSLRYTPRAGFAGTEQFMYSIEDGNGSPSSATVTINLSPGSRNDDLLDFTIDILNTVDGRETTNVQVGDTFLMRVSVDDIRLENLPGFSPADAQGVVSAFLDVLYTDELVAPTDTDNNPNFPFDITFGELFTGSGTFQEGDSLTPGLLNDIGGTQPVGGFEEHPNPDAIPPLPDRVELFTVMMQAVSPGIAIFQADPPDEVTSENVLINQNNALDVNQLRLGDAELTILPSSDNFTFAVDDSFPIGRDSDGNVISSASPSPAVLRVLDNDNLGETGSVIEFGLVTEPTLGTASINDNGSPSIMNDDFIEYQPRAGENGFEEFSYVIVTADGVSSIADVTLAVGNAEDDDLIAIDFALVNESGNSISSVSVGQRFGVEVSLEDLRQPIDATFVFAGFLDVLYDSGMIRPTDTISGDDFDFDVEFEPAFNEVAAVGTAAVPGIINEFGTLMNQGVAQSGGAGNPALMATLFFEATATGTSNVTGDPADFFPDRGSLLFLRDDAVPVDRIRYDSLTITVGSGSGGGAESEAPLQNTSMPSDVNNDGRVTPIDALNVINRLSRMQAEGETALASSQFYVDVNGDNRLTAGDALRVINMLSRMSANALSGEAEALPVSVSSSRSDDSSKTNSSDAALAELSTSDLVGDAPATLTVAANPTVDISGADSEDDESDVLDLLAYDLSGLGN